MIRYSPRLRWSTGIALFVVTGVLCWLNAQESLERVGPGVGRTVALHYGWPWAWAAQTPDAAQTIIAPQFNLAGDMIAWDAIFCVATLLTVAAVLELLFQSFSRFSAAARSVAVFVALLLIAANSLGQKPDTLAGMNAGFQSTAYGWPWTFVVLDRYVADLQPLAPDHVSNAVYLDFLVWTVVALLAGYLTDFALRKKFAAQATALDLPPIAAGDPAKPNISLVKEDADPSAIPRFLIPSSPKLPAVKPSSARPTKIVEPPPPRKT